jgi:membrane-associated phospholipid phosphatase
MLLRLNILDVLDVLDVLAAAYCLLMIFILLTDVAIKYSFFSELKFFSILPYTNTSFPSSHVLFILYKINTCVCVCVCVCV